MRDAIPEADRCTDCRGFGWYIVPGRDIDETCVICNGTGRKDA